MLSQPLSSYAFLLGCLAAESLSALASFLPQAVTPVLPTFWLQSQDPHCQPHPRAIRRRPAAGLQHSGVGQ